MNNLCHVPVVVAAAVACLLLAVPGAESNAQDASRVAAAVELDDMNFNWRFIRDDPPGAASPDFDDSSWRTVQLPHDWSIENIPGTQSPFSPESIGSFDTGYTVGGVGWYRKTFEVPGDASGGVAYLDFGGIYLNSDVFVNGQRVGGQHYGYTSFAIDITDHLLQRGVNTIAVRVNNDDLNSRWYSGSGIYRPARLVFTRPVHTEHWGPQVTTPLVTPERAAVVVATRVVNRSDDDVSFVLASTVLDPQGGVVGRDRAEAVVVAGEAAPVEAKITVETPGLWGPGHPTLYTLRQILTTPGQTPLVRETSFGIRRVEFDPDRGMLLNGESVLLRGLNMHHDNYMLGAAAYPRAEERRVERILAAGYNALRCAHNPPSRALLDAADRLGLLVINESFDTWNRPKWDHENDYSSRFAADWKRDLTNFIKRDRSRPSIIMWSIGNEIPEQNEQLAADTSRMLQEHLRTLDPTRPITIGANTSGPKSDAFLSTFDIVGYNYQEHAYESDRERFPNRLMYGSETYSQRAFDYWSYVERLPYVIGDFVWTGWDYLGEASIGWNGYRPDWDGLGYFPWNTAYCGEIDLLGYKRPYGFYRDVLWRTGRNRVSAFVQSPAPSLEPAPDPGWQLFWSQGDWHPCWTWRGHEGEPLEVVVFSAADEVELLLNGETLGRQPTSADTEYRARFTVPYQPGRLTAIGYTDGQVDAEWSLDTAGPPAEVRLRVDRTAIDADGMDICYVTAELFDADGVRVYHWEDDATLEILVEGPGSLLAVGNGNPVSLESFAGPRRKTFQGRAVAVVRSLRGQRGEIRVTAQSDGLETNELRIMAR
ncbi:MAG: glycoside hydrolase family 2 TIM barrel-domain containing protein [Planctomycetota bacterium]